MPNPVTTGTTYAGEFAGKYIQAALLSAQTLENGLITVMPNVKYKSVLQVASYNDIVKDAQCDFNADGTLTLTEKIIQPEEFQVNVQLCAHDLKSSWQAAEMGFSAFDGVPASFEDYVIGYTAAKVASQLESTIWSGQTGTTGEFDGFYYLATAGGSGCVAVTGTAVTAANVIDEMGKVVDAIPQAVYGKDDVFIYVAPNVARAYIRALGGFGANGLGANGVNAGGTTWFNNGALSFDGIPVVVAQGLPASSMMAAQKSNMFFGTGLLNDTNEVRVIDMSAIDGSQNLRIIMRYTAAVQMGINSDVVIYA
jgi:hypothetical protein|tara:strand:+ start:10189 stop:11118 length:930 start_codon:yes stop_codon:yes gene_type:complete